MWSGLCQCGRPPVLGSAPWAERRRPPRRGGAVLWAWAASCSPVCLQDPALKLCLVQSVCMASQAICSSAQASSFHFSRKAELVAQMMVSAGQGLPAPRVAPTALPHTGEAGLGRAGARAARDPSTRSAQHPKPAPGRWLTRGKQVLWPRAESRDWPPAGVHQGRAAGLPENTHSEEGHARLHLPGVSFSPGVRGSLWGGCLLMCSLDEGCGVRGAGNTWGP